ncbi:MAG TPA: toll/interleukin-1 receptor domain-containing protein [Pyrinomonadaceae bacterium]|jgi:hypothetical protein
MAEVFVSHIHEEEEVAKAVQRFLQQSFDNQQNIFLSSDQRQVFAGENWLERIRQELASASVVVLLLSQRSVERPWVNFEAGAAWLAKKVVIPVCFGKLSKDQLPKQYAWAQALNLAEDSEYLVKSVAQHLKILPPPPFGKEYDEAHKNLLDNLEALEDVALSHAIEEGEHGGTVDRGEIFEILEGNR